MAICARGCATCAIPTSGGRRITISYCQPDEVDAAGVGRRPSHLDEATAFRLSHLDEFTAGDRVLLRGEELRRALAAFDDGL